MPFGILRYPQPPDPRPLWLGVNGSNDTGPSPWRFFLKSVGALPPYDPLNDGILIEVNNIGDFFWEAFQVPPQQFSMLQFRGDFFPDVQPSPFQHTAKYTIEIQQPGTDVHTGQKFTLVAPALQGSNFYTMTTPGTNFIPNGLTISDVAYDRDEPT